VGRGPYDTDQNNMTTLASSMFSTVGVSENKSLCELWEICEPIMAIDGLERFHIGYVYFDRTTFLPMKPWRMWHVVCLRQAIAMALETLVHIYCKCMCQSMYAVIAWTV
jgi:hypothetical protein